jgi:hypothetical protein
MPRSTQVFHTAVGQRLAEIFWIPAHRSRISQRPGELCAGSARRQRAVEILRASEPLKALSGYVSSEFLRPFALATTNDALIGVFQQYSVKLWTFCARILELIEKDSAGRLRRPFGGTPFGTITFNFGPWVCTIPHKDFKNLSWGWCSITSLGNYDPQKGGHLILWGWGIAIEFPPHSTIFIPSAIIEHSNTAVQAGETRMSVTQYNSAGLFRWAAYGFMPKGKAEDAGVAPEGWWSNPKHMFSKVPSC